VTLNEGDLAAPSRQGLGRLRWPYALPVGIALAAAVMLPWLIVTPDRVRGVPGALAVLVAGVAAVWGGPAVGAAVAFAAGGLFGWVLSKHDIAYSDSVISPALWALAAIGIGVLATRLREAQAAADRLLRTDPLTGLLNRRSLNEALLIELRRAEREQRPAALVLLDLDRFKEINDRYGHRAGDQVLVEVARRLSLTVRAYDVLTRWGGDEFCLLLPSVTTEDALRSICWKLSEAVNSQPVLVGERTISIGASIGCLLLEPDRWDPASALDAADLALYAVKRLGGDPVRLFSDLSPNEIAALAPGRDHAST
jgi:diguanylate cyclase (GGDEF)-like protein